MQRIKNHKHAGDTMGEGMFAIAIFCMVMILSINLMNNSLNAAQSTLESSMARNAIDAQAEGLRFIHDSYILDKEKYGDAWKTIVEKSLDKLGEFPVTDCGQADKTKAFVLNLNNFDLQNGNTVVDVDNNDSGTPTYPQIDYSDNTARALGIWVNVVPDLDLDAKEKPTPNFYDFHIRTCWNAPGKNVASSLDTVIRLYNPDRGEEK